MVVPPLLGRREGNRKPAVPASLTDKGSSMRSSPRHLWLWVICSLWPAKRLIRLLRPIKITPSLVRIGSEGDGGYLLPSGLNSIEAVFSPGVAESSEFELVFAQAGIPCFLIDGSVNGPAVVHENLFFERLWLGTEPLGSESTSLEKWVRDKAPDSNNLLLQMDIEGAEWEVVTEVNKDLLRRFQVIVIEIHNLGTKMIKIEQRAKVIKFIRALTRDHFVAHFHPNNCCPVVQVEGIGVPNVVELTLLRKDKWMPPRRAFASLPHELDVPSTAGPDVKSPWP